MIPTPSFLKCPQCGSDVEIWSDEEKVQCPTCGIIVSRGKVQSCLDWCEYADKCKDLMEAKKREKTEH
jgi:anaerobic ribonucleoside-triphosphate reductase